MMFLKRLFDRKEQPAADQLHGAATPETQADQNATRKRMEAEVADDREHRGATDARPDSEQHPAERAATNSQEAARQGLDEQRKQAGTED